MAMSEHTAEWLRIRKAVQSRFGVGWNTTGCFIQHTMVAALDANDFSLLKRKDGQAVFVGTAPVSHVEPPVDDVVISTTAQHKNTPILEAMLKAKLNVWLGGEAGSGKTQAILHYATSRSMDFYRVNCGPQMSRSDIFGYPNVSTGEYVPGHAYRALKSTNPNGCVLLFDEMDRMNPAVAVQCNAVTDDSGCTFPNGETLHRGDKTLIAVAANTFGAPTADFHTAQKQDQALLSRFAKLAWDVDEAFELALFGTDSVSVRWVKYVQSVRRVAKQLGVKSMGSLLTPRTCADGIKMLRAGGVFTVEIVREATIWAPVPVEDRRKIEQVIGV